MQRLARFLVSGLILVSCWSVSADTAIDSAKALFARYVNLSQAYDPAITELYADDAVIHARKIYKDGRVREMDITVSEYKPLIKSSLPIAKDRGDGSTFDKVSYVQEGAKVRITATRYSILRKNHSPHSMLVAPDPSGKWLIVEETAQAQQ